MNRRTALGLGTAVTAGAMLSGAAASSAAAAPVQSPRDKIRTAYEQESARAGGRWFSYISLLDTTGAPVPAVTVASDEVVEAYSVNKIAVAVAVLDKVDRHLLQLNQTIPVTSDIVVPDGDGIFSLDGAYPSDVTLGHALAALLTVSDDTAVRLCGSVCPSAELNSILVAKGFPKTQVEPVANPNRFFLGTTTAKETNDLLWALVNGRLLTAASTEFLLHVLRSPIAFNDGIRRTMSSDQRARIATKAGWFDNARNEAGLMFDTTGAPVLAYAMFADGQADPGNFGATHPAVQARATMGPKFLAALDAVTTTGAATTAVRRPAAEYHPSNGG